MKLLVSKMTIDALKQKCIARDKKELKKWTPLNL